MARLREKGGRERVERITGLPISTYFSATKMKWLIDNVEEVKSALQNNDLMMGTVDTWLLWNLTGKRAYVTDVTNASRTQLMDVETLEWHPFLFAFFDIPMKPSLLPQIRSCCEVYGKLSCSKLEVKLQILRNGVLCVNFQASRIFKSAYEKKVQEERFEFICHFFSLTEFSLSVYHLP